MKKIGMEVVKSIIQQSECNLEAYCGIGGPRASLLKIMYGYVQVKFNSQSGMIHMNERITGQVVAKINN